MAMSLERLDALTGRRLQRIGLSATQRPLEEVARFLGGVETAGSAGSHPNGKDNDAARMGHPQNLESALETNQAWASDTPEAALRYRPVTIVNASAPKQLKLRIEV